MDKRRGRHVKWGIYLPGLCIYLHPDWVCFEWQHAYSGGRIFTHEERGEAGGDGQRGRDRAESAGMNNWWHKLLPKSNQNSGNWTVETPSVRQESRISSILILILTQYTWCECWSFNGWGRNKRRSESTIREAADGKSSRDFRS